MDSENISQTGSYPSNGTGSTVTFNQLCGVINTAPLNATNNSFPNSWNANHFPISNNLLGTTPLVVTGIQGFYNG